MKTDQGTENKDEKDTRESKRYRRQEGNSQQKKISNYFFLNYIQDNFLEIKGLNTYIKSPHYMNIHIKNIHIKKKTEL